jgi:uncharacterized membrane protein
MRHGRDSAKGTGGFDGVLRASDVLPRHSAHVVHVPRHLWTLRTTTPETTSCSPSIRGNTVSGDGSIVVGYSYIVSPSHTHRAWRWTEQSGMHEIVVQHPFGVGLDDSRASVASADGQFVAGSGTIQTGFGSIGSGAFRWSATGGTELTTAPVSSADTQVNGIEFDGSSMAGNVFDSSGNCFYWSTATGLRWATFGNSGATALSSDGRFVVGVSYSRFPTFDAPLRWAPAFGHTNSLQTFAGPRGRALGVSRDGSTVVGWSESASAVAQPIAWLETSPLGQAYCDDKVPSSSGCVGHLTVGGNPPIALNDLELSASHLPPNSSGYFLTSRSSGSTYPVSNSQGRLCLGGFIGRYAGPGQVKNSGATGSFSLVTDLTSMPQPFGNVAAHPGETWNFRAWHRDANPALTSNFTDAVSVTFQ